MDVKAIFGSTAVDIPPEYKPPDMTGWLEWTEIRDGVTWRILQRPGASVANWCDWPPTPLGIHQRRPTP